jgi:hypothetical protein
VTLTHTYDGSALVNKVDLAEGTEGWSSSGDYGEPGVGGAVIFDPATDIVGWRSFWVEESACSIPRIFTGFTYRRPILHLDAGGGNKRRWDTDLIDLNVVLQFRKIVSADGKRPAETDLERITWLLGSGYLTDLHDDYGSVVATSVTNLTDNPGLFGEADYRHRTPLEVLQDVAAASGKRFSVRWDPVGEQMELFYDLATATISDSTLRISNDPADEDANTFAPIYEAQLIRSPEDIYDGIDYQFLGSFVYRTRPATHTAFKIHRDFGYSTDRVGLRATAETLADAFLEIHSDEVDSLELTILVPSTKVNHVRELDRIQTKLTHLPGYESFIWLRVLHRVVAFEAPGFYRVKLELDVSRLHYGGDGGAGGGFPLPPPPGAHWWEGQATIGNRSDPAQVGPSAPPFVPGTYNYELRANLAPPPHGTYAAGMQIKNAASTAGWMQSGAIGSTPAGGGTIVGSFTIDGSGNVDDEGGQFHATGSGHDFIPAGGFAETYHMEGYSAGPHAPDAEKDTVFTFWIDLVGFNDPQPPLPGQRVDWVLASPSPPDGDTTTFFAPWPYADGSLEVRVDWTDQTAAVTESDPTTGEFELAFAPNSDERVWVRFLGR